MKKVLFALLCSLLLLATAIAEPSADLQAVADSFVPQDATFIRYEIDDGLYEYKYQAGETYYDVKLNPETQIMIKLEMDVRSDRGGASATLTDEAAKVAVLGVFPDAAVHFTAFERDDGAYTSKVAFSIENYVGKMELHSETGAVLGYELNYSEAAVTGPLTADEAKQLALSWVANGRIVEFEQDYDDGRLIYEIEIIDNTWEYTYDIDADTGTILDFDQEYLND